MTTPAGWQIVKLDTVATLAVPPTARVEKLQPIDSIFGMFKGEGYEVIYDYGRSGEDLAALKDEPGYTRRPRSVDGRTASEVSFRPGTQPWGFVRILQVQDGRNVLTVRVSCVDEGTCALAEDVFNSVKFASRS